MKRHISPTKAYEESEDVGRNPSENATFGDVIGARFNRRDLLKGALAATAISATVSPLALALAQQAQAQGAMPTFNPADASQVLSGVAPGGRELRIGFEDLPAATGDNDFQDVVIGITALPDDSLM